MISVDTEDIDKVADILRSIKGKHINYAIKNTLNDMAVDTKTEGYFEKSSKTVFDYRRNKTFIRAITGYRKATGSNIDTMQSGSGVMMRGKKTEVAERMEKQEDGGTLDHTFTPTDGSRTGNARARQVRGRDSHKNMKVGKYDLTTTNVKKKKMVLLYNAAKRKKAVKVKHRKTGTLLIGRATGKMDIYRERSYISKRTGKKRYRGQVTGFRYKIDFKYAENKGRKVRLRRSPFVAMAGHRATQNFEKHFRKNAEAEIKKAMEWGKI